MPKTVLIGDDPLCGSYIVEEDREVKFDLPAHRGANQIAPENTFAAYDAAVNASVAGIPVNGIEIDIHMTADDKIVVIHDATVDRTTNGTGKVRDFTIDELKLLDAGSWFSPSFADQTIPILEEVLERYGGVLERICIELKQPQEYPGMLNKLADILNNPGWGGLSDTVIVLGYDRNALKEFHRIAPNYGVGILGLGQDGFYDLPPKEMEAKLKEYASYATQIHIARSRTEQGLVSFIQSHGLKVFSETANSVQDVRDTVEVGCDGCLTNIVERKPV